VLATYPGETADSAYFVTYVFLLQVQPRPTETPTPTSTPTPTPTNTPTPTDTLTPTPTPTDTPVPTETFTPTSTYTPSEVATESLNVTETVTAEGTEVGPTVQAASPTPTGPTATPSPTSGLPTFTPTPFVLAATFTPSPTAILPPGASPTLVPPTLVPTKLTTVPPPTLVPTPGASATAIPLSPTPSLVPQLLLVVGGVEFDPIAVNSCILDSNSQQVCASSPLNAREPRVTAAASAVAQISFKGPQPSSVLASLFSGDGVTLQSTQRLPADNVVLYTMPVLPGTYVVAIEVMWQGGTATYFFRLSVGG
jgi:hypothetical protein